MCIPSREDSKPSFELLNHKGGFRDCVHDSRRGFKQYIPSRGYFDQSPYLIGQRILQPIIPPGFHKNVPRTVGLKLGMEPSTFPCPPPIVE